MKKNVAISVRVSVAVKQAAERAAKDDTRTVASYVEKLIIDDLKAKGLLQEMSREQALPRKPWKR